MAFVWSCVHQMMDVLRGNSAVQMGVAMCAKLECVLGFVSLRGKSTMLVKASQLEMDATHGKPIKLIMCVCVS